MADAPSGLSFGEGAGRSAQPPPTGPGSAAGKGLLLSSRSAPGGPQRPWGRAPRHPARGEHPAEERRPRGGLAGPREGREKSAANCNFIPRPPPGIREARLATGRARERSHPPSTGSRGRSESPSAERWLRCRFATSYPPVMRLSSIRFVLGRSVDFLGNPWRDGHIDEAPSNVDRAPDRLLRTNSLSETKVLERRGADRDEGP